MNKKYELINTIFRYLCINFFITLSLNFIYLSNIKFTLDFSTISYLSIALISNTGIFYLAFSLIFGIICFFLPIKRLIDTLLLTILPLFHIFIFIDAIVFKTFKFHINSLVINLFLTEGATDSVTISKSNYILFGLIALIMIILEYFTLNYIHKKSSTLNYQTKQLKTFLLILIIFIISDKTYYSISDLLGKTYILSLSRTFPYYQPLTIKRAVRNLTGYESAKKTNFSINSKSTLKYPKKDLIFTEIQDLPNIMVIVIDAWRFDMFNQDTTPHIYNYSKNNLIFENHFSGGNASRFGVFSLLYGMYGTYWQQFLQTQSTPVLIDKLSELNYNFKITSSTKLTYPEFRRTAFSKIQDTIEDNFPGENHEYRDILQADRLINWLKTKENTTNPFFTFSWFDAPHGPYSYTKEFEVFTPSKKSANYITTSKRDYTLLKNSYKNAILFNDDLVNKILNYLKTTSYYDNTIVIITADHGEEFYENGYLGHTSAFSKYQTKVPLILHLPDNMLNKYNLQDNQVFKNLTSHHDITPMLMSAIGCMSDDNVYSCGINLLIHHDKPVFSSGWNDGALISNDNYIIFSTESWNSSKFEIRDNDYNLLKNTNNVMKTMATPLQEIIYQMGAFTP
ncbi:MAG: sulfatase-like hydrolase/transferase [Candidatus Cloacimonetes bacterium]|nr:sulfatase-like hydrolase/transferase [Candidatus Cloacimonadota bacterium]